MFSDKGFHPHIGMVSSSRRYLSPSNICFTSTFMVAGVSGSHLYTRVSNASTTRANARSRRNSQSVHGRVRHRYSVNRSQHAWVSNVHPSISFAYSAGSRYYSS